MNKKLLEIHCSSPKMILCACCDSVFKEVKTYYKVIGVNNALSFQSYLDCCKNRIGNVVDWDEEDEINKIVKYELYGGQVVGKIKGYCPKK